jgi:membrane-bound lytic murein transglycosylase D
MNPHIMRWCTPPDAANTLLYLPAGAKQAWPSFCAGLAPEKRVKWVRYQIKKGDTPESLALHYDVSVNALQSINRLTQTRLVPGHYLFIPVSDVPLGGDVAYSLPPEPEIKALDLPDYEFSGITVRHRIRSGDNLGVIARRYHVSVNQLCRWNRITGRTILRPGHMLVVSRPLPRIETASAPPQPIPPVALHPALVKDTLPAAVSQPVASGLSPDTATPAAAAMAPTQVSSETPAQQPAQTSAQAASPAPAPQLVQQVVALEEMHVVEIGETAFSISRKYGLTVDQLAALNGLDMAHPVIRIGQALKVTKARGM